MTVTTTQIADLIETYERPVAVSLLLPTIRSGRERRQNEIRLSNLLSEAESQLTARADEDLAARILQPARDLLGDSDELTHPLDGLAIYLSPDRQIIQQTPFAIDEDVSVSHMFRVTPVLPLLLGENTFHLLAVSANKVRLFRGNAFCLELADADELPANLEEALRIDEYRSTLQHHATATAGEAAMFHGHGGSDLDVRKQDELLQYFRHIDRAVCSAIDHDSTLIFAGVDYLFPIYQKANNHAGLINESVEGNFDDAEAENLHEQAWPLIESRVRESQREQLAEVGMLKERDLAADDLGRIIQSARSGRVETLYLSQSEAVSGQVDSVGNVRLCDGVESDDLLNVAAIEVLKTGGTVRVVPSGVLPDNTHAVAFMRYAEPAATN